MVNMIKNIMVVDDSALMRRVMCDIINADTSFQVTEVSQNGEEAYHKIKMMKFDAIVLDINMPKMNGLELLEKLKKEKIEVAVIMASTLTKEGSKETIRALELGALDFVTKPDLIIEAKGEDFASKLMMVLRGALLGGGYTQPKKLTTNTKHENKVRSLGNLKLVALACSTGGPKALQSVIPYLPKNLNAPVVLVQHMPKGFTKSMADRLNELSEIFVKEAEDNEILENGTVYVAPGGYHMMVETKRDGKNMIKLSLEPAIGGLRPCANLMYESIKKTNFDRITCVVLTGMGMDGMEGILSLDKEKSIYTIAQDEETSVVYGMPRAVADAGVTDEIVPLKEIAKSIIKNVGVR